MTTSSSVSTPATGTRDRLRSSDPRGPLSRRPWFAPVAAGAVVAAVEAVASWVPQAWGDEGATLSAVERPLPALWRMLGSQDAVHGLYYLLVQLLGGPLTGSVAGIRLLSAVAIGVAAAGMLVLARRFVGTRGALLAVVVFALIPQTGWAAIEARSSAMIVAVAAWLGVALVRLVDRGRLRDAALWGGLALLGILLNVYVVLALLAQVAAVAVVPSWRRRTGAAAGAFVVALLVSSPVLALVVQQRGQVAWIPPVSLGTVRQLIEHQWFGDDLPFAVVAWILVVLGVVGARRSVRRTDASGAGLVALCVLEVVVPSVLLVAVSLIQPLYQPRYTMYSVPYLALLVTVGLLRLRPRWMIAALAVLVVLGVPAFVGQRLPEAKASDWDVAAAEAGRLSGPGGAIDVRIVELRVLHPELFSGRQDLAISRSRDATGRLWDELVTPAQGADRARGPRVVVVTATPDWVRSREQADFAADGFVVQEVRHYGGTSVVVLERRS